MCLQVDDKCYVNDAIYDNDDDNGKAMLYLV